MKDELIAVFEDNQRYIDENQRLRDAQLKSMELTEVIAGRQIPKHLPDRDTKKKNIFVTYSSTVEAARALARRYPKQTIAVLNFASATNPGGGVKKGASAQEESLCRCSTLYGCLDQKKVHDAYYIPNRTDKDRTALHTDDVVYTPGVLICRDDGANERLDEKDFVSVDVISCAAPNLRKFTLNQYNPGERLSVSISDEDLLKLHLNRARNIFLSAINHGATVLILGAFGCGAFKNDPYIVAEAYNEVAHEYAEYFTEIEFAIYSKDSNRNFEAFLSKIEQK